MARKSIATYVENGYGQVEPNHLSAQRTAQIYAQLPAKEDISVLENGQFVKYNYPDNRVDFEGEGEWMLVYNEEKLYGSKESRKDYAMTKESQVRGIITPRVFKTNIGDIYTTNFVVTAEFTVGDNLQINAQGVPEKASGGSLTGMIWQVAKICKLADGQKALKLMRIQ